MAGFDKKKKNYTFISMKLNDLQIKIKKTISKQMIISSLKPSNTERILKE